MKIRWHGQSAYTLTGADHTVAIDPFGDLRALLGGRRRFAYPPVPEHDAPTSCSSPTSTPTTTRVEVITGDPQIVRSTAGRFETPVGEVVAIASEHDDAAGTSPRPEHDLRLHARRRPRVPLRRLRPGGAAARAARGDRRGRPAVPARRRRADHRRRRRRPRSPASSTRAGSCRCTTAPRRSTSSSRPTRSSRCTSTSRSRGPSICSSRTATGRPGSCTWHRRTRGAEGRTMAQSMHSLYAYGRAFDTGLIAAGLLAAIAVALCIVVVLRSPAAARAGGGAWPSAATSAPGCGISSTTWPHRRARGPAANRRPPPPRPGDREAGEHRHGRGDRRRQLEHEAPGERRDRDGDRRPDPRPRPPPDHGAEQRGRQEVEPAHARVPEVDLLQRGQRFAVVGGDADLRERRLLERRGRALDLAVAPHQVHVDGDQDDQADREIPGGRDRADDGGDREAGAADQDRAGDLGEVAAGLPGDHVEHRGRGRGQEGPAPARRPPEHAGKQRRRERPQPRQQVGAGAAGKPHRADADDHRRRGPGQPEHRVAAARLAADRRDRHERALGDAQRRVPREQEHGRRNVDDRGAAKARPGRVSWNVPVNHRRHPCPSDDTGRPRDRRRGQDGGHASRGAAERAFGAGECDRRPVRGRARERAPGRARHGGVHRPRRGARRPAASRRC